MVMGDLYLLLKALLKTGRIVIPASSSPVSGTILGSRIIIFPAALDPFCYAPNRELRNLSGVPRCPESTQVSRVGPSDGQCWVSLGSKTRHPKSHYLLRMSSSNHGKKLGWDQLLRLTTVGCGNHPAPTAGDCDSGEFLGWPRPQDGGPRRPLGCIGEQTRRMGALVAQAPWHPRQPSEREQSRWGYEESSGQERM